MAGRPGSPRVLSLVQCRRNRRRRHAMTVFPRRGHGGLDEDQHFSPARAVAGEPGPEDPVGGLNSRTNCRPLIHGQLAPQGQDLNLHRESRSKQVRQEGSHGLEKCQHSGMVPRLLGGRPGTQAQVPVTCRNSLPRMLFEFSGPTGVLCGVRLASTRASHATPSSGGGPQAHRPICRRCYCEYLFTGGCRFVFGSGRRVARLRT